MKAKLKSGEIVEIETDCLFNDQYNTKEKRIFDKDILEIFDDARVNKGKCGYCGKALTIGETCTKHEDCTKYPIDWFTPKNTYFLKYPKGYQAETKCNKELPLKIGSYKLIKADNGQLELYNSRKNFIFSYNSEGRFFVLKTWSTYKTVFHLDVPSKVNETLKKVLK